jgi:hypothetical protein
MKLLDSQEALCFMELVQYKEIYNERTFRTSFLNLGIGEFEWEPRHCLSASDLLKPLAILSLQL